MTTYNAPIIEHLAGVPSQSSDAFNPALTGLICGESPVPVTRDMAIAESMTFADPYIPVGFDGDGNLIHAVWAADETAVQAVAILLTTATSGAGENPGVPTLIQGCVSMDVIKWPASYDTEAKKLAAFDGAPTPASIVVRKRRAGATVSAP